MPAKDKMKTRKKEKTQKTYFTSEKRCDIIYNIYTKKGLLEFSMKKWTISPVKKEASERIAQMSDLGGLLSHIMAARGIDTREKLIEFFNRDTLEDPFALTDMEAAVETVCEAVDAGEKICVFGDYDCDGICASAILYDYLLNMGADAIAMIPERSDGYGLSAEAVERIHATGAKLVITVDNGISAISESKMIAELDMKLIVTDHHQPYDELPVAAAVVNPHRIGDLSEFKELCGAGVALKLCAALDGGDYEAVCEQYLDMAAVATVADVVPLTGENRVIVSKGLRLLANTENYGLRSLMENCGASADRITSQTVAYTLAPRINAASRFGSAVTAFNLLTAENEDDAEKYADELMKLNSDRKTAEGVITDEIFEAVDNDPELRYSRVMTVSGKGWNRGIIGIIAARLVEIYEKPAVILSIDDDGLAVGSCRSVKGFNIFRCLDYCCDLLIKYGGHELAGGLTVTEVNIQNLRKKIEEYAEKTCPEMPRITVNADKLLRGADLTYENAAALRRLQPFGVGNPEPVFALSGAVVTNVTPLSGGAHTRLGISYDGAQTQVLMFRTRTSEVYFKPGDRVDLMANMQADEYNGSRRVTLLAVDIRPHFSGQDRFFAEEDVYLKYRRGEKVDSKMLKTGIPTRDEMVRVYSHIRNSGGTDTYENMYLKLSGDGINAFKLMIILDAFCEAGLMTFKRGKAELIPPKKRADLSNSPIVAGLIKAASGN